tara:strand:- start:1451 stop:1822 length:372 start_codon:yes stop_codon:yes gene_type:complete
LAKILVVEDSDAVRAKMRHFLEENGGHSVLEASDGANALDIIKENSDIDLIFCDVNMPVMDGIAFAQAIHNEEDLKDIPFVFCTTETASAVKKEIKNLGIKARYIMKPVTENSIVVTLRSVFG